MPTDPWGGDLSPNNAVDPQGGGGWPDWFQLVALLNEDKANERRGSTPTFSGGGGGSFSLFGGGAAGSPGTIASPGLTGAATGATGGGIGLGAGAGAGGGAVAGSSWWQNPDLWLTGLGAVSGYLQNKDAKAAGGGQTVSYTEPNPALAGDIFGDEGILSRARQLFNRDPRSAPRRGGASLPPETQAIIDQLMGDFQGGSDLVGAGSDFVQGTLGDEYGGNTFLRQLAAEQRDPAVQQLLTGFLGGQVGGNAPAGYTPGLGYDVRTGYDPQTGQTGTGSGSSLSQQIARTASSGGGWNGGGGGGAGGGGSNPGGGLFDQNIERFLDFENISPETQNLIDAMQKEASEDYVLARGDLAAEAEGAGRFGGSDYQAGIDQLYRRHDQNVQAARSAALERDLIQRRNAALTAMGMISERDLTREQIAAQKQMAAQAAAAASSSAARAAQVQLELGHRGYDIQEMLGTRGQDIDVLGMLVGREQGNLDRLGSAAGTLGSLQLGGLSAIPGLEDAGYTPLEHLTPLLGQKTQVSAGNAAARYGNALDAWNRPQQQLDDFTNTILSLSDRFSRSYGEKSAPFVPSTASSVIQGGLGGYFTSRGLRS